MPDVVEPFGAPEIFFDGVTDIHIVQAVFRCALFSRQRSPGSEENGDSVIVARIAVPVSELPEIIEQFVIVLTRAAKDMYRPPFS